MLNKKRLKEIWRELRLDADRDGMARPRCLLTKGNRWLVHYHLNQAALWRRCGFIEDAWTHLRIAQRWASVT